MNKKTPQKRRLKIKKTENDLKDKSMPSSNNLTIEINGPEGPEPTRYGDWEKGGRCTDF